MDKNNPSIVAMCGFTSIEHAILGSCIGQNFGNCWSPLKFKPVAIAHQQWTHHLWMKGPKDAMDCATSYIKRIPVVDPISKDPPVKAQKDALNTGVLNSQGIQKPLPYSIQVDDCVFADVKKYIKNIANLSIIGLKDTSSAVQPFQEHPLSIKERDPFYAELRPLIGHDANTW